MSRLGSDVLALACIAGGAAVGGLATMALANDSHNAVHVDVDHAVECAAVGEIDTGSQVVVSLGAHKGHKEVIIVAPNVRVHQPHCVTMESFEWAEAAEFEAQGAMMRMEGARMQMEMAREMMELRFIDLEGLEMQLEGLEGLKALDFDFDFSFDLDLDNLSEEIEQSLQLEMAQLEEELKRLDEIGR